MSSKVEQSNFMPGYHKAFEAEGIVVAAWCSDKEAVLPPEQVHLVVEIRLDEETVIPIITRFKSPDTLGLIIRQLIEYRREVWSDADLITGEDSPPRAPVIFPRQNLDIKQLVKDWLIDELDEDIQVVFVSVKKTVYGDYQTIRDDQASPVSASEASWQQENIELGEYAIGDRTIVAGYGVNTGTLVIGDCSEAL